MKIQLLTILVILPILLIPPTVYGEEIFVVTDKPEYYSDERIFISGEVDEIIGEYILTLRVISPSEEIISTSQLAVGEDKKFGIAIEESGVFMTVEGVYTLRVQYGDDENNSAETEFYYYTTPFPVAINIQTDKDTYYMDSIIYVNGTTSEINWDEDTTIYYDTYDENDNIIESLSGDYLEDDGTFFYRIITADKPEWDIASEVRMDVTIQNNTATTFFQYVNDDNKSSEANYDRIQIIFRLLAELADDDINTAIIQNAIDELN